jgi:hypothetical protein
MHAKQKGNIGELAIATDLAKQDMAVFTELGDLSKVDLIALIDNVPITIQVKARKLVNGAVQIKSSKSGPDYSYKYKEEDVDIFAIYVLDTEDIGYVSCKEIISRGQTSFRIEKPLNKQIDKVRYLNEYKDIRKLFSELRS